MQYSQIKETYVEKRKGERPQINLQIQRGESAVWNFFKHHHYLTKEMNKGAKCFLFTWDDVPVGFISFLNQPNKGKPNGMRFSRLVVLPDYQGLGLSGKILDFTSAIIKSLGDDYEVYAKAIHPQLGKFWSESPNWIPTAMNGKVRKKLDDEGSKYKHRLARPSFCYKYVGDPIYGYEELLKPINELRKEKKMRDMKSQKSPI